MTVHWFHALEEADRSAAEALRPFLCTDMETPKRYPGDADLVAREWIEKQFPCPNMILVPGATQVDLIEPLLSRTSAMNVLLADSDLSRLVASLNQIDTPSLAEAIRQERLFVDPGESEQASIERFMRAADFSRVPRIHLLEARPLSEDDLQLAVEMTRAARELLRFQACDMSTRLRFGTAWQGQTLRNLPQIIRHPGISSLFGAFKGIPALVVAAGPSLNKTLPYLVGVRHRMVVIAVGRILGTLIHRLGIVPDLAVTGDGQELVMRHFAKKPKDLPVAASCFTEPQLIQSLDRVFFMEITSMGIPAWLRGKIGSLGEIFPGGNVATAAMSVAVEMGCNAVFLAGLDFSYAEDGKTHVTAKPSAMAGPETSETPRLHEVPGNYQATVSTNRQMLHYIDYASDYIQGHPDVPFYNVNHAGARIDGSVLVRPEEAASLVVSGPVNASGRIARIYTAHADDVPTDRILFSLRDDLPQLQSLRSECNNAAMVCNRMIMLMRRPGCVADPEQEVRRALAGLEPLDHRLKTDPVMQLIEARLEKVTRLLSERMMSPEERAWMPAVRSFRRWREFYRGVADACQKTEKLLNGTIREIEEGGGGDRSETGGTPDRPETNLFEHARTYQPEPMEALV